jgi:hypothetical protein
VDRCPLGGEDPESYDAVARDIVGAGPAASSPKLLGPPPPDRATLRSRSVRSCVDVSVFVVPAPVTAVLPLPSRSCVHQRVAANPVAAVRQPAGGRSGV